MNTLNQNELVAVCGGFAGPDRYEPDDWDLQLIMDQFSRQEDEQRLRYLLGGSTD
jgi:hypothetical protein